MLSKFAVNIAGRPTLPSCIVYRSWDRDRVSARYFFMTSAPTEDSSIAEDASAKSAIEDLLYRALDAADLWKMRPGERRIVRSGSADCSVTVDPTLSRHPTADMLDFLGTGANQQIRIAGSLPSMQWTHGRRRRELPDSIVGAQSHAAFWEHWLAGGECIESILIGTPSHIQVTPSQPALSSPNCATLSISITREVPFTKLSSRAIYWWEYAMQGRALMGGSEWIAASKRLKLIGHHDTIADSGVQREEGRIQSVGASSDWIAAHCQLHSTNTQVSITQSGDPGWKCIAPRLEDMVANGRQELVKFADNYVELDFRKDFLAEDIRARVQPETEALSLHAEVANSSTQTTLLLPVFTLDVSESALRTLLLERLAASHAEQIQALVDGHAGHRLNVRCIDAISLVPLPATVNFVEGKARSDGVADALAKILSPLRVKTMGRPLQEELNGLVEWARNSWRLESKADSDGYAELNAPTLQPDDELMIRIEDRKAMTTQGWSMAPLLPPSIRFIAGEPVDYVLMLGKNGECSVYRQK
ncbi:MAG: hypothetical protein ABL997_05880 [Planctomycetota bacterium]